MIATFESYTALDELVPAQEWDVVSNFECKVPPYVLGVWVKLEGKKVQPLYLTQEQLNALRSH